jgi:hypothetical protein
LETDVQTCFHRGKVGSILVSAHFELLTCASFHLEDDIVVEFGGYRLAYRVGNPGARILRAGRSSLACDGYFGEPLQFLHTAPSTEAVQCFDIIKQFPNLCLLADSTNVLRG